AEAQAKAGHDIFAFPTWEPSFHADLLEPVDDIMKDLIAKYGAITDVVEYLGRPGGVWRAVPATVGSQMKPPCTRIDYFKQHAGIDIQAMYPAGAEPDKALTDTWTWDTFLAAAEKCHKAGVPFGLPVGQTTDAVDWVGALFQSYGAVLIDPKGNIVVKSDPVRQVLEYCKKLARFLPPEVFSWDDASNNKWLVAGKGALIMNPPSAWAVAKRDNLKVAEQCWTHPMPKGPRGRYCPKLPYFWGIWSFSKNKEAGKSLLRHISQREAAEKLVAASQGYDIPGFKSFQDFKTWAEEGPPKGTLYNYAKTHDQVLSIALHPAPPQIAAQAYAQAINTKMFARVAQGGEAIEKTLDWAARECEGFMRT
ncbi:MAG: ABC transporter substrate-binding protein, partial [Hyphomicrobiaceae bacterium]